jgi:hypothetical protein
MLTVMHTQKDGRTYANIAGVGPIPKGISAKTIIPEITPILYAAPDNTKTYGSLPKWLQERIDKQIIQAPSSQVKPDFYDGAAPGNQLEEGSFITDDDIPF